jgi:hypothetical protein
MESHHEAPSPSTADRCQVVADSARQFRVCGLGLLGPEQEFFIAPHAAVLSPSMAGFPQLGVGKVIKHRAADAVDVSCLSTCCN